MSEEQKKELENRTEVLRKKMEYDEEYYKEFIKVLGNQALKDKEDIERLKDRVSKYEGRYVDMTNSYICDCQPPENNKKLLTVDDIKTGLEEDLQKIDDALTDAREIKNKLKEGITTLKDQVPEYKKEVGVIYEGLRDLGRRSQKQRGKR